MNNVVDLDRERRVSTLLREIVGLSNNPDVVNRTMSMLNEELPIMQERLPTSIRLPVPLIARLDALVVRLNADPQRGMERVFKRSDLVRLALIRGIEVLESELDAGGAL